MPGTEWAMDRITDDTLPLFRVAKYWAGEPSSRLTKKKIANKLVEAVWRGDLTVEAPAGHVPRNHDYRYSLLRATAGVRTHDRLLFIRPGELVDPVEQRLPDGTTQVDPRERIAWVGDGEDPDEATAKAAFAALASVGLDAYDKATIRPILRTLPIDREALRQYCQATGMSLPEFWFDPAAAKSTALAKHLCKMWLADLVQMGSKPGSKAKLRSEAQKRFPDLSGAAFDSVWNEVVPPEWRAAGAPTKPKRRDNL